MRLVLLLLMALVGWASALFSRSGDLRLVRNGFSSSFYTSGHLEIYYGGQWKSVCYDSWTTANTRVACRQLGFAGAVGSTASSIARFGVGSRTSSFQRVRCTGSESRLINCLALSFGSHYCISDVTIYCSSTSCSSSQFRCTNGQCVSSSSQCTGIETCFDGSDEMNCTSCQNGAFWCSSDQLCISSSKRCNGVRSCSDGSDEMNCTSCQSGTFHCSNGQCVLSSGHCDRHQDCSDGSDETGCTHFFGDLRLVQNGFTNSSYTSGRLEIYHRGLWKTVCDYLWTIANTRVACHQLGFSTSNTSWSTSSDGGYGSTTGSIWLGTAMCSGTESRLTSCSRYWFSFHICSHAEDVAIDCSSGCSSTQFRCANGQCISSSSRCDGNRTCSDGTDEWSCTSCQSGAFRCSNGQCIRSSYRCDKTRQCTDGSDETGCPCYPQFQCTSGQCISPYYRCDGTRDCSDGSDESGCVSCSSETFQCSNQQCINSHERCDGTQDCSDGSDETGCYTSGPSSGDLRLVRNGFTSSYYRRGRLEVYYNGQWGTVCIDGWTRTNTRVACRQLGFSDAASSTSYRTSSAAGFGSTSRPIWLDNVRCSGNESRLASCSRSSYGAHNCDHSKDVAIYCYTSGSNTGSGIPDTGTSIGGSVGGFVGIFSIIFVVLGICRFARSASRITTSTQPVAPTTTVATTSSHQDDETNVMQVSPPSNPSQESPLTNEGPLQGPPPPYESDLSQAPPPSYETCTHPSQAPPPSYKMCTHPSQAPPPSYEMCTYPP